MQASLGHLTAQLADNENHISPDLVTLINQTVKPPTPVTADDIYIRAMYLVSNEINSYGGCFPIDEHPRLASLLIDSPVLVGHRKDTLPIGRTFHAICTERDGQQWVKSYFYWLKSSDGAEALRENIDGGVYKECSIGFTYLLPECSICGEDIRTCRHEPMHSYAVSGSEQQCYFNYRQVERVLETSLVYRGAVPDTSIARDLRITKQIPEHIRKIPQAKALTNLADLPTSTCYLVTPSYPGIDCQLDCCDGHWSLHRLDDKPLDYSLPEALAFTDNNAAPRFARLVGLRGRERCSSSQLERFLVGRRSIVSNAVLYLYPQVPHEQVLSQSEDLSGIRIIRHRFATADQLPEIASQLATKNGVEIRPTSPDSIRLDSYLYLNGATIVGQHGFLLQPLVGSNSWLLELHVDGRLARYLVRQFDLHRLHKGARFVADRATREFKSLGVPDKAVSGAVTNLRMSDDGYLVDLSGGLKTTLAIRPIKMDGRSRYLLFSPGAITPKLSS